MFNKRPSVQARMGGGVLALTLLLAEACTGELFDPGAQRFAFSKPEDLSFDADGDGMADALDLDGDGKVDVAVASGIRLTPPDGLSAERAMRCEADHAMMRRLSGKEYLRTLQDLFPGVTLPALRIGNDATVAGFSNNVVEQRPERGWVEDVMSNAEAVAAAGRASTVTKLACASQNAACFAKLVKEFGARVYRRPLSDAELADFGALFSAGPTAGNFTLAAEFALATFLASPDFLYRPEIGSAGKLAPFEVASRLSYLLWGTMPDASLFAAAESNQLSGAALDQQVDRMLADPRARDGLLFASNEWLGTFMFDATGRQQAESYGLTPVVRQHMRDGLDSFLWNDVWNADGGVASFLTGGEAYVDAETAPFFGVTSASPTPAKQSVPGRYGILTHPLILAMNSHADHASPVWRGIYVLSQMMCDPPQPPPANAEMGELPKVDESGKALTNREGYDINTSGKGQVCAGCHMAINPFGFAFEGYDAAGRVQNDDHGLPLDTSGTSAGFTYGKSLTFSGAQELVSQIAEDDRVKACIVDRWVRYATAGAAQAYDPCWRKELLDVVKSPGSNLGDLVVAIVKSSRFSASEVIDE